MMTKEIDYVELLKLAHEKLGSQSDMIELLEKKLSHAETMSDKEQSIRDLEQQSQALSDAHKVIVEYKMFRCARDYIDFRALELLEMSQALKDKS
jgi:Tfp pilus assembly protein PilN